MSRLPLLVVLIIVLSLPASAQVASAELTGTVLDPTGAGIANARVTVTNAATNVAHQVNSGAGGWLHPSPCFLPLSMWSPSKPRVSGSWFRKG